jgi:hypothetical protein
MFALITKLFQNPEVDLGQSCNPNGDNRLLPWRSRIRSIFCAVTHVQFFHTPQCRLSEHNRQRELRFARFFEHDRAQSQISLELDALSFCF